MKNPKEIISEASNLAKQKDDLAKRLVSLRADAEKTAKNIRDRAGAISDALLKDLPADDLVGLQTSNKERLSHLQAAIANGEKALTELDGQITVANREVLHLQYDPIADELDVLLIDCVDKLYEAVEDFKKIDDGFKRLHAVGNQPPGIPLPEHYDQIQRMRGRLSGEGTMHGIAYSLSEIEQAYPQALLEAREKKGK